LEDEDVEGEEVGENVGSVRASDESARDAAQERELVFKVGEHEVVEESAEDISLLRCVRCGAKSYLTESSKLAETPCSPASKTEEVNMEKKCVACGKPATKSMPSWNITTNAIEPISLCDNCSRDWLKLLRKGPEIRPNVYGRARGYFFQPLKTWFEEIGGAWPCPACPEFFDEFLEVVRHFSDMHRDRVGSEVEEVSVNGVKGYRCWQGIYCSCGYLCENERHLLYHYRRGHP